ncbi:MAG: VWA domain-containing protein [Gammaproteobacteria bacterium]|nr:VWA domain-containing protein [Gammaproteobacteria bacterium]
MRRLATHFRYGLWDGSQQPQLSGDQVLDAIAEDLMEYGDLKWAMRNLVSRGMTIPDGAQIQGLRDMLKRLREKKRERLQQFDLSSVMQDIERKLAEILDMERNTIDEWLNQDSEAFANDVLRKIAERSQETLNELPEDPAGRMKALEKYEFLNPDAQRKYLDLLNELRKAMTQTFFKNVENMVKDLSDGDIERLKDMVQAMSEMLVKKIAGEDPGFDAFMDKFGDMFGDDPPQTLDDLLEQMRRQMAASQSLLNSLTPDQQQQLQSLMSDRLGDPQLESNLRKLAQEMDFLDPQGSRYRFDGKQQVDLEAAMDLMNEMHQIDDLIDQLQAAERGGNPDHIDSELAQSLLGDEAMESIDDLKKLLDALEEAGYVRPTGDDKWELTPRGSRMIGQRALGEIYARLRRQSLGNHAIPEEGRFGERLEQTKAHEFGDPFHLHMPRTIRNAIDRDGPRTPVHLRHEDFEIYRSEQVTSTATAMLVDLSWSMALRGSFQSAKKVALALHNLITSQYPRDSFYIIGFAAYARELKAHDLPFLQWDEYLLGTNMQHALLLAERLLSKHDAATKQVIMISDGEPTAHLENGQAQFAYPPMPATIRETYKAVKRCTKKGIAINTFMLDANQYLKEFMDDIARINGGRVFYTSPEKLGEYVLVDYVQHKRKKLAGR